VAFRDGLGDRRLVSQADGTSVEVLCLRRELSAVPSFEFALRERASRLSDFTHSGFSLIRGVDRPAEFNHALTVASEAVPGPRLSSVLTSAHDRGLPVPIGAALCLIRQLMPAVAILHETARDAAHGAIAPERLVLGPGNRLVLVEYVLGSALEQLLYSRERYWAELRVALPRVAGLPRFDHLADVTQMGAVALQLIVGRLLKDDEYPARVGEIVATATAMSPPAGIEPLAPPIRSWIVRALQLDPRHSFPSAIEARAELERAIAESGYDASPEALDSFLARYNAPVAPPVVVSPQPRPAPSPERVLVAPATVETRTDQSAVLQPLAVSVSMPSPVAPRAVAPHAVAPHAVAPHIDASAAPAAPAPPDPEPDYVAEFQVARRRARGRFVTAAAAVVVIGVLLAGGGLVAARFLSPQPEVKATGTLTIATNPSGAQAIVDGVRRGVTPVTLSLAVGPHRVELRGDAEPRVIPITMTAGAQLSHFVDLPKPAAPPFVATTGPTVADLAPPPPAAPAVVDELSLAGWIAVDMKAGKDGGHPLDVDVYEGDHLLGNSRVDRIMLPVGRHDLELVNAAVGLRVKRSVQIGAGKVSRIAFDRPNGTIAVNALPWAEVWVDGDKVGETPIGNLEIAVGSHDVVFRHPDLGERQQTVIVTAAIPARISVDLRKP
jgi:hypothetical protein